MSVIDALEGAFPAQCGELDGLRSQLAGAAALSAVICGMRATTAVISSINARP